MKRCCIFNGIWIVDGIVIVLDCRRCNVVML